MNIQIHNRYNKLQELILCYPVNFSIDKKTINKDLMFEQYNKFINTLSDEKVITYFLDPKFGISQVYTRDIAFVIDDILFIGKMSETSRNEEFKALEEFITDKKIKIKRFTNYIEGGDVIVHNNVIFVGLSKRTSIDAISELRNFLLEENKKYEVIPVNFNKSEMLHLDCVFNVVSNDICVVSDYLYDKNMFNKYFKKRYYVSKAEAKELAINFLLLENNKLISSSQKLCELLSKDGIKTIYVDYSEIIKGGGSFTCSTLPILSE